MSEGNPLISFGDLTKPATVLIEKISNAIGVVFEPHRITRKARADAEAEKIKTIGQIELNELQQRAIGRFVYQESRKQENIERITAQAAASLAQDAKVENLEEDWIAHFFKQCDTVSDHDMQSLWSRLLSGEASNPGTFSKRTIDFVSSIDKKDAALFTSFGQFVWVVIEAQPLIYDVENNVYTKHGIDFLALKHLNAIGLISFDVMGEHNRKGYAKRAHAFYYGQPTEIEFGADANNQLRLGHVILTSVGKELVPVCGATRNQEFYEYVIKHWFHRGLILSSVLLSKSS